MKKILFILGIFWFFMGCATTEDACASVTCSDQEQCVAGICELKDGYCNQKSDCDENLYCGSDKKCIDETAYCAGLGCREWEQCSAAEERCILSDGRCNLNGDCTGLDSCNTTTHLCEASDPCDGITCGEHGRCVVDSGSATCLCDTGYHANGLNCVVDVVDLCKDVVCDSWQTCNSATGSCDLKPNRCKDKEDCNDDKICDANHYCINESNPCDGQDCSGFGTCSLVDGNPICSCNTNYFNDGDLSCVNPCDTHFCEVDSICQATGLKDVGCICAEGYNDQFRDGICVQSQVEAKCSEKGCLVEAGWFIMGCDPEINENCQTNNRPVHPVYLENYWIDQYEVTVAEYRECVEAGICIINKHYNSSSAINLHKIPKPPFTYDRYPMNGVNWKGAVVYCEFIGKALPTEAQWEKAARGTDQRSYPWGDSREICEQIVGCGAKNTQEVGSKKNQSPYGAYDMSGNVAEWVRDYFSKSFYTEDPVKEPYNGEGTYLVTRGGGYSDLDKDEFTTYRRVGEKPEMYSLKHGFRCILKKKK